MSPRLGYDFRTSVALQATCAGRKITCFDDAIATRTSRGVSESYYCWVHRRCGVDGLSDLSRRVDWMMSDGAVRCSMTPSRCHHPTARSIRRRSTYCSGIVHWSLMARAGWCLPLSRASCSTCAGVSEKKS